MAFEAGSRFAVAPRRRTCGLPRDVDPEAPTTPAARAEKTPPPRASGLILLSSGRIFVMSCEVPHTTNVPRKATMKVSHCMPRSRLTPAEMYPGGNTQESHQRVRVLYAIRVPATMPPRKLANMFILAIPQPLWLRWIPK